MISAQEARRAGLRVVMAALTLAVPCGTAGADMSWRIHDAGEVMASYTRPGSNGLVFEDPSGQAWDLITTIEDPAITNRGAGRFYPIDAQAVDDALRSLQPDVPGVSAIEIFLLPYPRGRLLDSSADRHGIYLSPGTRPPTPEQVHALVIHELGHIVHLRLLPDSDTTGWDRYRRLRGIEDTALYNDRAAHRNRPHEIFAEDFRALFGGDRANYSRSIENKELPSPAGVAGLRAFIAGLSAPSKAPIDVAVYPNPLRAGQDMTVRFSVSASASGVRLDIVDAAGRLVRRLDASPVAATGSIVWDGRGGDGLPAASGIYFARITAGRNGNAVRFVVAR